MPDRRYLRADEHAGSPGPHGAAVGFVLDQQVSVTSLSGPSCQGGLGR